MVTDMITMKLEREFRKEIDRVVKNNNYQSRTEFLRDAAREKMERMSEKEIMQELLRFKGISKTKTTEKEYRKAREEAFEEYIKERGWKL